MIIGKFYERLEMRVLCCVDIANCSEFIVDMFEYLFLQAHTCMKNTTQTVSLKSIYLFGDRIFPVLPLLIILW